MSASDSARLFDAHFHAGFLRDPESFVAQASARGLGACCMSVLPDDAAALAQAVLGAPFFVVANGFHPFWAYCERSYDSREIEQVASGSFVGEIGLDFGAAHVPTKDVQLRLFERIARACGDLGGRVLSVHAVRSSAQAIDILERCGCFDTCTVVFHWFSGTSEDLRRASTLGALFSVGPRMLATRRGRAYASSVPETRLLVETDDPALDRAQGDMRIDGRDRPFPYERSVAYEVEEWEARLRGAYEHLSRVRGKDMNPILAETVERVFLSL